MKNFIVRSRDVVVNDYDASPKKMGHHDSQLSLESARKSNLEDSSPKSVLHRRAVSMNKARGTAFGIERDYDS